MKHLNKNLPRVVIFGRTNVGKSTLFNRLTERNQALISDIEGTTRDSNIGVVNWGGKNFELIDTGGIMDLKYLFGEKTKTETIEAKVQKQARDLLSRADLILFTVDAISGLLPHDKQMALFLKKINKNINNIILVVNKADNPKLRRGITEFHKLALGEPVPLSANTGSGTGDLLDIVISRLKKEKKFKKEAAALAAEPEQIKVCIIGKPNVGKSSLINSILGEERVIVSSVPHTTREPQDTVIEYGDRQIKFVDTAGISKKGKQTAYTKKEKKSALEKYGIEKSLKALEKSDIALLVLDISEDIARQDARIVEEIFNRKKSLIIIANKWDLIPERDTEKYKDYIYDKFPFARWAPIQFTSALTKEKVQKIIDLIKIVDEQRKAEMTDSGANSFLMRLVRRHKPAKGKGLRHPHIHEFKQVKSNPPVFELRIGAKDNLHFSYVRFIENRLREKYGFLGTPISIFVTKNKLIHGKHDK